MQRAQQGRPASRLLVSPDQPAGDPLGSWYGGVRVLPEGLDWPVVNGLPMVGLAQLAVGTAPYVPRCLRDIAALLIFISADRQDPAAAFQRPADHKVMALRSFEGLVVTDPPATVELFAARPGHWQPHEHDLPVPESGVGSGPVTGIKIGGWPRVEEASLDWGSEVAFAAQLGSELSAGVDWGPSGYVLIGRRPDGSFIARFGTSKSR